MLQMLPLIFWNKILLEIETSSSFWNSLQVTRLV